jgi:hypothetical protein
VARCLSATIHSGIVILVWAHSTVLYSFRAILDGSDEFWMNRRARLPKRSIKDSVCEGLGKYAMWPFLFPVSVPPTSRPEHSRREGQTYKALTLRLKASRLS